MERADGAAAALDPAGEVELQHEPAGGGRGIDAELERPGRVRTAVSGLVGAGIVTELEGPGGELVRQLVGLAAKSAGDVPLTADELAYSDKARTTAAERLGMSIDAALERKQSPPARGSRHEEESS